MRLAAIDLGTNTVRLLIVEARRGGGFTVLEQDQRVTRLGEGLAASGVLGETPMARTAAVVEEYVGRADRWQAGGRVTIVATSAVREASNGGVFVSRVERATGRRVRVVSGEEEARLMLRGVMSGLGTLPRCAVLFDIGGGSTEFLLARDGAVVEAVSLRLGVVPLAERYPFPGPVAWDRYAALAREVAARLARELPAPFRDAPAGALVGTAGTVTTLAALDLGLTVYDPGRVQGHVLRRDAVEAVLRRLGALDVAGRAALPCLEPGRADVIVQGIPIVTAAMELTRRDAVIVSDTGLREGLVAEALEAEPRA